MKKEYVTPEVNVVVLRVQDILTDSQNPGIVLPDDDWL